MATQASDTSSKTRARGSSDELAVIAQRAQAFTNASGTAIALGEGNTDEITCRARSGATAPDVGTPMRVEGSFTGLCIQSGKELRCDDAETDTRVDTAALRSLGIRSLVVTPIKEENRVVGVLMVFAPTAHAFTITHVAVLKTMADQISALLQRERRAKEGGQPEPARLSAPAPVAVPKPVSSPVLPPPVVIKPSAPAARAAAFPVVSRVEPIKTAPVAEDLAISTPARREERRAEPRPEHRPGLGTLDALAGEGRKANNNLMIGVAAAAVIVAVAAGTFAYRKMHKTPPPVAVQHAPDATNSAAGQPAGAPGSPATAGAQPAGNTAAVNPAAGNTAPAAAVPAAPATKPAPGSPAADTRRAERAAAAANAAAVAANNPPPAKPSPTAVAVTAGTSKIASPGAGDVGADISPVLNAPGTGNTGTLTSLIKPVASSTPSMMSQSELEPVQVLKRVAPVYPAIAKARRLSGTVTVQIVVGKDGKASNLQFIGGPPVFRDAAFEAVKQWQFKPARLNGQPIEQSEQIRMNFTP
jgi:TonB family protein